MILSQLSGMNKLQRQIDPPKQVFFYVMCNLVMAGMLALVYTNDLFTAYVFIEILALASCALMMARQVGHTMVASMRYMILSLLGSGLILIAIALTYNLTGHLLMENIRVVIARHVENGEYALPISVIIGLFIAGIAIKCGVFPFHMWLPDAYAYSTSAAGAVLSSVVSKAYFFLLVKIFYRVIGMNVIESDMALNLLLALGVASMILAPSARFAAWISGAWWRIAPCRRWGICLRGWGSAPPSAWRRRCSIWWCTRCARACCFCPCRPVRCLGRQQTF